MSALRPFEARVVKLLAAGRLSPQQLHARLAFEGPGRYEYSGSGYFLTLAIPGLPLERIVCREPVVVGRSGDVTCGFVVFMERGELTLECFTWGAVEVPEGFRDGEVELSVLR